MHNAAYRQMGLNWVYTAFDVEDVGAALAGVRGLKLRGLSVTIPHKLAVMEYLDEIEPIAQAIGAVNTIINDNGRLIGTNTDGYGALRALKTICDPHEKHIVILGNGGGARAVACTLAKECHCRSLTILGLVEEQANVAKLANDVNSFAGIAVQTGDLSHGTLQQFLSTAEIVIQATPVGMAPNVDATLVPKELWRSGQVAFDLVYNPAETMYLKDAKEAGAVPLNGMLMLVNQGAEQIRRWSGQEPPVELMVEAVRSGLRGA